MHVQCTGFYVPTLNVIWLLASAEALQSHKLGRVAVKAQKAGIKSFFFCHIRGIIRATGVVAFYSG